MNIKFLLASIIGLLFGIIISIITILILNKRKDNEAEDIIKKAKKDADNYKKNSILELKDEQYKLKQEFEKELKEKKSEYKEQEERLQLREDSINKRDQILQDR